MSDTSRRIRRVDVTPQLMPLMFTTDTVVKVTDGLPPFAGVVNYGYDSERDMFYFHVEHDSFDVVREGEEPPGMTIEFEDLTGELDEREA